jgi:quercetin dioxygenase-like cupin family protein
VIAQVPDVLRDATAGQRGALWRLEQSSRQLDANVVRLPPAAEGAGHVEPDVDVLLYVIGGSGALVLAAERQPLTPGCLVWLPRGTRRALSAGPEGLVYLTSHQRRAGLTIRSAAAEPSAPAASQGGEPACLLHLVCPGCGRLSPEPTARFCGQCGDPLPSGGTA